MKSRTKKTEELKQLKSKIPGSKMVVLTTFSRAGEKGLSVAQMTELKRALKSLNSEYLIAKKSLTNLALKGLNYDGIDIFGIEGSIGLAIGGNDSYAVSKKLYEFSKKNQALKFFGAIMGGDFIDADKFLEIAKMPSREMLLGRLVGMLTYPITGLYVVLGEVSKQRASAS
ncbi:MAG: 50S ribosomal protein L10 [Candidatus Yanofskybacteria bacterium]|nr:50S ribosomal protein L10 [Candidatus Yanofskybacteria bacterium]